MCMERRRFSQTMVFEWRTAFVVTKCHGVPCSLPSRITTKVLKNCKTFSLRPRPRPRPNVQDQDQDVMIQDQDFHFCPRGAWRPRPWSRGLHHCANLRMLLSVVRWLQEEMLQAYRDIVYNKVPSKIPRLFHGSAGCQPVQYVIPAYPVGGVLPKIFIHHNW